MNRGLIAALFGSIALALGGCAETQLAAHTVKKMDQPAPSVSGRGHYKVGEPYQINSTWYYPVEDYNYDETGIASWYGPGFHAKFTANGEIFDQNDLTAAHRTLPMPSFVRVTNLENGRSIVLRVNDRGPFARGRILDVSARASELLGFDRAGTARVRVQILAEESRQVAQQMRSGVQVASAAPPQAAQPLAAPRSGVVSGALPPPSAVAASPAAAPIGMPVDPTGNLRTVAPQRTQIFVQAGAFENRENAQRLSQRLRGIGPSSVTPVTVGGKQMFRVRVGPLATVEEGDRMLDRVIADTPGARLVVD
jgi:rare lipoprotein A